MSSGIDQLLTQGMLGSPEEALSTLMEAFCDLVFDPEHVKEGLSVVRLPPKMSGPACASEAAEAAWPSNAHARPSASAGLLGAEEVKVAGSRFSHARLLRPVRL